MEEFSYEKYLNENAASKKNAVIPASFDEHFKIAINRLIDNADSTIKVFAPFEYFGLWREYNGLGIEFNKFLEKNPNNRLEFITIKEEYNWHDKILNKLFKKQEKIYPDETHNGQIQIYYIPNRDFKKLGKNAVYFTVIDTVGYHFGPSFSDKYGMKIVNYGDERQTKTLNHCFDVVKEKLAIQKLKEQTKKACEIKDN